MPVIDDAGLRAILENARTVAVVGFSAKTDRPSYGVARFLRDEADYTVYLVNPTLAEVEGDRVYPDLASLPGPVDVVDVFRNPEALAQVAEDAIAAGAKVLWGQLGVVNMEAAAAAEAAGLQVVMDHCMKIEFQRLNITPRN